MEPCLRSWSVSNRVQKTMHSNYLLLSPFSRHTDVGLFLARPGRDAQWHKLLLATGHNSNSGSIAYLDAPEHLRFFNSPRIQGGIYAKENDIHPFTLPCCGSTPWSVDPVPHHQRRTHEVARPGNQPYVVGMRSSIIDIVQRPLRTVSRARLQIVRSRPCSEFPLWIIPRRKSLRDHTRSIPTFEPRHSKSCHTGVPFVAVPV